MYRSLLKQGAQKGPRYRMERVLDWLLDDQQGVVPSEYMVENEEQEFPSLDVNVDDVATEYTATGLSDPNTAKGGDFIRGQVATSQYRPTTPVDIFCEYPTPGPEDGYSGYVEGIVKNTTIDEATEPATGAARLSVDQAPLAHGGTTGTISGTCNVPTGAATEPYTTIQNVSFRHFKQIIGTEEVTNEDGTTSTFNIYASRVEVEGDVSASSGSVDVFLRTDTYYFQGSIPVNTDGSFSGVFDDGSFWNDSDVRLRHPSTREWSPSNKNETVFSDYTVQGYRQVDLKYYQWETPVYADETWSVRGTGGRGDARIELHGPGGKIGRTWRNIFEGAEVWPSYEITSYIFSNRRVEQDSHALVSASGQKRWSHVYAGYPQGRTEIELVNTSTGEQVGPTWFYGLNDSSVFSNFRIRFYTEADKLYLDGDIPAPVGPNEWFTPKTSTNGLAVKLVEVLDDGTENVHDIWDMYSGFVRSYYVQDRDASAYDSAFPNRMYTYDGALALIVYSLKGYSFAATRLARTLARIQEKTSAQVDHASEGVIPFFAQTGQDAGFIPYERNGAAAWVLDAYLTYIAEIGDALGAEAEIEAAFRRGVNRLYDFESTESDTLQTGLYRGGRGRFHDPDDDGVFTFDPDYIAPWAATEHNTDIWFVFQKAADVLGDFQFQLDAESVRQAMLDKLWDSSRGRYLQGTGKTDQDTRGALDAHSWAGMATLGFGDHDDKALAAARKIKDRYQLTTDNQGVDFPTTGYPPYTEDEGHDFATDQVWWEGTYGVAKFWGHLEDKGYLEVLYPDGESYEFSRFQRVWNPSASQQPNGSFQYALRGQFDSADLVAFESVASTAWGWLAVNAYKPGQGFWGEETP